MKVTLQDIQQARERLRGVIHPTETDLSRSLSELAHSEVYLKFENTQRTGSFKIRGAYNKIISLNGAERARGVVASSAGNHAQGVALSAQLAKVKSTIVMPEMASQNKVSATKAYGAEVILFGESYDDAYAHARKIESASGAIFVHPYEDEKVIAGQGTIALEILEAIPDLDSIVVAVGGGGLMSGVAVAVKALKPSCRVIGVQASAAPGMSKLFNQQSYDIPAGRVSTIADGIAVKAPSNVMFDHFISKYVDEMVTVSEDEIAAAIVCLLERAKTLTEGAGAASTAAILSRSLKLGKKTCSILCGGNIDLNVIAKVVERGLITQGRITEISVVVDDQPGSLWRLTKIFSENRANVLDVRHDRVQGDLSMREAKVDFLLETTGPEHGQQIRDLLTKNGVRLISGGRKH